MEFDINYLAVLVVALISMVLGFLWYGPLFGKMWMRLSGIRPDTSGAARGYILATIGALVMAYVLAHVIAGMSVAFESGGAMRGVTTGFFMWLGFVAPVQLGVVLWEGKSFSLYVIKTMYYLVLLVIGGAILGAWA
jgi:hypothetical protein